LAQGFSSNDNPLLVDGSHQNAELARTIVRLRQQARDGQKDDSQPALDAGTRSTSEDLDRLTTQSYEKAMHIID
jgi:hypothetical protein